MHTTGSAPVIATAATVATSFAKLFLVSGERPCDWQVAAGNRDFIRQRCHGCHGYEVLFGGSSECDGTITTGKCKGKGTVKARAAWCQSQRHPWLLFLVSEVSVLATGRSLLSFISDMEQSAGRARRAQAPVLHETLNTTVRRRGRDPYVLCSGGLGWRVQV